MTTILVDMRKSSKYNVRTSVGTKFWNESQILIKPESILTHGEELRLTKREAKTKISFRRLLVTLLALENCLLQVMFLPGLDGSGKASREASTELEGFR